LPAPPPVENSQSETLLNQTASDPLDPSQPGVLRHISHVDQRQSEPATRTHEELQHCFGAVFIGSDKWHRTHPRYRLNTNNPATIMRNPDETFRLCELGHAGDWRLSSHLPVGAGFQTATCFRRHFPPHSSQIRTRATSEARCSLMRAWRSATDMHQCGLQNIRGY